MTNTQRPELEPCPFCGGTYATVRKLLRDGYADFKDDPDAYAYTIGCHACAAEGGWAKSESGARRWWNTRAARPASPLSEEALRRACTAIIDAIDDFFVRLSAIARAKDDAENGPSAPLMHRSLHATTLTMNEILLARIAFENDLRARPSGSPTAGGEEPGVWVVLDAEELPEAVYCREDTAREYADDPNENKAGEGPFTVARFVRAASCVRLDGKADVRDADGLIGGDPMAAAPELAMLREMANLAREYFDERNRPSVSWDGMPSVQDQKRRRDRIAELLEALASSGSPASPLSEEERQDDEPGVTAGIIHELEDGAREAEGHGAFLTEHRYREAIKIIRRWSPEAGAIVDNERSHGLKLVDAKTPARMGGVALIAAERKRQKSGDDGSLVEGQLADSAVLMLDTARESRATNGIGSPLLCAYKLSERHRNDPIRLLTVAGAFIAAEIDRLSRSSGDGT